MPTALLRQTFENLSSVVDPDTGFSKSAFREKDNLLEALRTDWLEKKQGAGNKIARFLTQNTAPQVLSFSAVWPQASRAAAQAVFAAWLFFLKEASPEFAYRAELGQHAIALAEHRDCLGSALEELKLSESSPNHYFLSQKASWLPWLGALQTTVQARIGILYAQASTQYNSAYGIHVSTFQQHCNRLNLFLPAEADLKKQVALLDEFEKAKKKHTTSEFQRANTTRVFQKMIAVLVSCVNGKIKAKCNTPAPQWKLTARPYANQDLGHLKTAIDYFIRLADCIQRVPAAQAADIFGQDSKATEPSTEIEKQPRLFAKLACLEAVPAVAQAKSADEAKQLRQKVAGLTKKISDLETQNESCQQQNNQLEEALQASKASQAKLERKWLDDQKLRDENKRLTGVVETTKQQNANLMNQNAELQEERVEDKKTIESFPEQIRGLTANHEAEKERMQSQFDAEKKTIQSQFAARAEPIKKNLTYLGAGALLASLFFGAVWADLFTLIEKEKDHFSGMLTVVLLSVAAVTALGYFLLDYMAKPVAASDQPQLLLQV